MVESPPQLNQMRKRSIPLPPKSAGEGTEQLDLEGNVLVVVGANGSGKSRFGRWIEKKDVTQNHRISAHRALNFPHQAHPIDPAEAARLLHYGSSDSIPSNWVGANLHNRWKGAPETALLDDYQHLVSWLLSDNFFVSDTYRTEMAKAARDSRPLVNPPTSQIDTVFEIWNELLPHRTIKSLGSSIQAVVPGNESGYHAKEMSDGERVIFYLIAQVLSAKRDGLIIIDEPELHLHRAIQNRLWDAIEKRRPDLLFVYITHDLDFASSRKGADRLWLKEYKHPNWDFELLPRDTGFSDLVLMELLGSRHPVIFVEGEKGKIDYVIYQNAFPDHTVIPVGSCEAVIHATASFAALESIHHNKCFGIIDGDLRDEQDIQRLEERNVTVLPVAQAENLLLLESVVRLVATFLAVDPDSSFEKVKDNLLKDINSRRESIVGELSRRQIETMIKSHAIPSRGKADFIAAFSTPLDSAAASAIYDHWDSEVTRIVTERDYQAGLLVQKGHGICASVAAPVFSFRYKEQVLRWLSTPHGRPILDAIKAELIQAPIAAANTCETSL